MPISRFNKGEASKIFEEVKVAGIKVVVKNNIPVCVLVSPAKYDSMMDEIQRLSISINNKSEMLYPSLNEDMKGSPCQKSQQ